MNLCGGEGFHKVWTPLIARVEASLIKMLDLEVGLISDNALPTNNLIIYF